MQSVGWADYTTNWLLNIHHDSVVLIHLALWEHSQLLVTSQAPDICQHHGPTCFHRIMHELSLFSLKE